MDSMHRTLNKKNIYEIRIQKNACRKCIVCPNNEMKIVSTAYECHCTDIKCTGKWRNNKKSFKFSRQHIYLSVPSAPILKSQDFFLWLYCTWNCTVSTVYAPPPSSFPFLLVSHLCFTCSWLGLPPLLLSSSLFLCVHYWTLLHRLRPQRKISHL